MSSESTIPAIRREQAEMAVQISPPALLQHAVASGASIEALEKLMALEERWRANEAKRAFNRAMAAVRSDLPVIVKSQKVDFQTSRGRTSYKYEDLHDVTEALTPVMAKHGLAFRWRTEKGEPVTVTCIVSHEDGHSEETSLSAPRDESGNKNAIQSLGSAITYLQRYTLKAALGVAASTDDDGRSSSLPEERRQPETKPAQEGRNATPATAPVTRELNREKLRDRMLANLSQFDESDLVFYAESVGVIVQGQTLSTWNLNKVPTTREGLDALVRDIEGFIAANRKPNSNGEPFSEPFWNAVITVPRAGMKRVDYMQSPDTIRSLYEAMKAGDDKARTRLFGISTEWNPSEWTDSSGAVRPPSAPDLECRKHLDAYLEWRDQKGERD